jgi:hypothetical protein
VLNIRIKDLLATVWWNFYQPDAWGKRNIWKTVISQRAIRANNRLFFIPELQGRMMWFRAKKIPQKLFGGGCTNFQ